MLLSRRLLENPKVKCESRHVGVRQRVQNQRQNDTPHAISPWRRMCLCMLRHDVVDEHSAAQTLSSQIGLFEARRRGQGNWVIYGNNPGVVSANEQRDFLLVPTVGCGNKRVPPPRPRLVGSSLLSWEAGTGSHSGADSFQPRNSTSRLNTTSPTVYYISRLLAVWLHFFPPENFQTFFATSDKLSAACSESVESAVPRSEAVRPGCPRGGGG